jgi:hypothetical protein
VLAGLSAKAGFAQQAATSAATLTIDGSKTPELIPDSTAFRLVLCGLAEAPNATSDQVARQTRKLSMFVTTEADRKVFASLLSNFYAQYAALRAQYKATRGLNNIQPFAPLRDALVSETITQLANQLTSTSMARFRTFVTAAKQRMIINHLN